MMPIIPVARAVMTLNHDEGIARVRTLAGDDADRAVALANRIGAPWYVGYLLARGFRLAEIEALADAGISAENARGLIAFDGPGAGPFPFEPEAP